MSQNKRSLNSRVESSFPESEASTMKQGSSHRRTVSENQELFDTKQ